MIVSPPDITMFVPPVTFPLLNVCARVSEPDVVVQTEPSKCSGSFVVVLYISSPVAGDGIRFLCAVVILGLINPRVVELTSNMADAVAGVCPTLTLLSSSILNTNLPSPL